MEEHCTHWKSLTDATYMGAFSLPDGKDMVLTIAKVAKEQVTGENGRKDECIVIHFKEPDTLAFICNKTNCKTITTVLGTPYIEKWAGHKIQLGSEKVNFKGAFVDALRVRPTKPVEEQPIACEECGQFIQPSNGMTASQVAAYTKKKYGKALCAECATKQSGK